MKNDTPASIIFFVIVAALFGCGSPAMADDVGITKARLIQESERSYLIEADVSQPLMWAIKAPIFPDRFQVSELEYITRSGWIVVQARATTTREPLSAQDKLLLPWMRNGVALTVQWQDGTIRQGLFLRSLEGIHVPMRMLMDTHQNLVDLCTTHFKLGLEHLAFKGIHLLLVVALWSLFPSRQLLTSLLYYTFGQAISLVLADLGLVGFDLLFADILGVLLIFMLARATARHLPGKPYFVLLFVFGLVHGLSYARELLLLALPMEQKVPAVFMFNLALDAGHFVLAFLLLGLTRFVGSVGRWKTVGAYVTGTLSITLVLVCFHDHVMAGKTDLLAFKDTQIATRFSLPTSQKSQTGGRRPRGARQLTAPVMSYLSVEPFEVRQEILVQARAAVQLLGVDDEGMAGIPLKSLGPVKKGILNTLQKANSIRIDGQPVEPVLARADFVTLGPAGVILRPKPMAESLDSGIIGLTLVYETSDMAESVEIDWRLFSNTVQKIEMTTADPFGGSKMILSPEENHMQWRSRLSGFKVPVIEEIAVEKQKVPVASISLFLMILAVMAVSISRKKMLLGRTVLLSITGFAFLLYPFVRQPVDLQVASQWTPSNERTAVILEKLLVNVYRSFDVRDENKVYDRLAMSVAGEQLDKIYLENRRSLEFENRGGARANVDEVKILFVNNVKRSDDGFLADLTWTVSGSVNHFGHTHYRRNKNHALISYVTDRGYWKIKEIELIDEKRML